jgi:hypothetical protein
MYYRNQTDILKQIENMLKDLEDDGKKWTIKGWIKQTVTPKYDTLYSPLWSYPYVHKKTFSLTDLNKKKYYIHGVLFGLCYWNGNKTEENKWALKNMSAAINLVIKNIPMIFEKALDEYI